jgi:hypothetical protein
MLGTRSHALPSLWNVRGWPTLFVIDQEGKIRYKGRSRREREEVFEILKRGPLIATGAEVRPTRSPAGPPLP